jgi:DNA primase
MNQFTPQHLDDLRARVSLSRIVGQVVKLQRAGREFKGLCPFHREATGSFTVVDDKGFYHCFGCGAHGDVIGFVMEYQGLPFLDAVQALASDAGIILKAEPATSPRELARPASQAETVDSWTVAQHILETARPARGTIVESWLTHRGLDLASPNVQSALDRLLFHPACPVSPWRVGEGPDRCRMRRPAMVGAIERVRGNAGDRRIERIGVHATYLRGDGMGKADLQPFPDGKARGTRMIWGAVGRGAVWLTDIDSANPTGCPLVAGEGIETTISAMDEQPGAVRGAAALSLGNLEGGMIRGPHGEVRMWNLRSDPERPPFLIRQPGAVIVAVDSDMKPVDGPRGEGVKVQERKGQRYRLRSISGLERAEICAALAVSAWRSMGAWPVRAVRPPVGMDFNDLRRARV